MNLLRKPPVPKSARSTKDKTRLAKVAAMPCVICFEFGMQQTSPTQVHHCICGRHSTARAPDSMTVPLCEGHHQGLMDTSKIAIHRERKEWVARYGLDTDWLSWVEERL